MYVDWASERLWRTPGKYQLKAMAALSLTWAVLVWYSQSFDFHIHEPDIGGRSGRVLLDTSCSERQVADCSADCLELQQKVVDWGLEDCPELSAKTCGPHGLDNMSAYREEWTYRDPQNSAVATFDFAMCTGTFTRWDGNSRSRWVRSTYTAGFGLGSTATGFYCDYRGRKEACLVFLACLLCGQILYAASWTYFVWLFGRGLGAFGNGGFTVASFVLLAEQVSHQTLPTVAMLFGLMFSIGGCAAGLAGMYVWDWRAQAWLIAFLLLTGVVAVRGMFESPKWLAIYDARNESTATKEAIISVINSIAGINGLEALPPPRQVGVEETLSDLRGDSYVVLHQKDDYCQLSHRQIWPRLLAMIGIWMGISFSWVGLLVKSNIDFEKIFPGDVALQWFFGHLVEIPAFVLAAQAVRNPAFGRRGTCVCCNVAGSLIIFLSELEEVAPSNWRLAFYASHLLGRMLVAAGIGATTLFTLETFPSAARTTSLGVCLGFGHMGALLAIVMAAQVEIKQQPLRAALQALPALGAGLLAVMFPETLGRPLPGYIEDLRPMRFRCGPGRNRAQSDMFTTSQSPSSM